MHLDGVIGLLASSPFTLFLPFYSPLHDLDAEFGTWEADQAVLSRV